MRDPKIFDLMKKVLSPKEETVEEAIIEGELILTFKKVIKSSRKGVPNTAVYTDESGKEYYPLEWHDKYFDAATEKKLISLLPKKLKLKYSY